MKLLGILTLLFVCLVSTVKAQQSTSKSTTSKTNSASTVKPNTTSSKVQTTTKKNPTTPKTNATTTSKMTQKMNVTTTSKLTTTNKKTTATATLKPSATTTVKRNVTTTTPSPTNIPTFFVCRDTNSSAATGILLPYRNTTIGEAKDCKFSIVAPPGQQIKITCSAMSLASYPSYFRIAGSVDVGYEVVVNRDYFSINNNLSVTASFDYPDWFECKWTTLPKDNTNNFKLCLHAEANTTNGTIQPLRGDATLDSLDRICFISIVVPSDYQIEFTCSSLNVSGYLVIKYGLDGSGTLVELPGGMDLDPDTHVQVLGRKYYSIFNRVIVESSFGYQDWFNCSYKAIPVEITTESKWCRHAEATTANGTISPIAGDTRDIANCAFNIKAAPYQQIRIICSVILLANPGSHLVNWGTNDDYRLFGDVVINQTYYSTPDNYVILKSYFEKNDWISCQWTTTTRENTTSLQLCRDNLIGGNQTANGTIQPMAKMIAGERRYCIATLTAPEGYQIQLSCSAIRMSFGSYFETYGTLDVYRDGLTLNRVYTSSLYNHIEIYSGFSQSDWFYCKWNIAPREISQNPKLCRHAISTVANGTITPIAGNTGPSRTCPFVIKGLPDRVLQISCSILNFSKPGYLSMSGVIGTGLIVNRVFYATKGNTIEMYSTVGNRDWLECKWFTTPKKNTTDFKICRDEVATSSGTLQPLAGDPGKKRNCEFSIRTTSSGQQIQMSCSAIKLNNSDLYVYGVLDSNFKLVLNRIYTSSSVISFRFGIAKGDWIDCKWTITPEEITPNSKLCRHPRATMPNGTITPLKMTLGEPERECEFTVKANFDQQIQFSCSTVRLSSGSYLNLYGVIGQSETDSAVTLHRIYYSTPRNDLRLNSKVGSSDTFNCTWTTIPRIENTPI